MVEKFHLVVGDIYSSFAKNENVITASEFRKMLKERWRWSGEERVVVGQGIGEAERSQIKSMLRELSIKEVSNVAPVAALNLTHKRSAENVLISDPEKIGPKHFEYELVLNDKFDRLADHVTGQHLTGMLLLEAARQAMIASLECEYIAANGVDTGLILERFDSRFINYVYPLPATLIARIEERDYESSSHLSVTVIVEIMQVGQIMCEMQFDITVKEFAKLTKIETRRAKGAIGCLVKATAAIDSIQAEAAL